MRSSAVDVGRRLPPRTRRSRVLGGKRLPTSTAELLIRLVREAAHPARPPERRPAFGAQPAALAHVARASRALHTQPPTDSADPVAPAAARWNFFRASRELPGTRRRRLSSVAERRRTAARGLLDSSRGWTRRARRRPVQDATEVAAPSPSAGMAP